MFRSFDKGEAMGDVLNNLRTRVEYMGKTRDDRLNAGKLKSLQASLKDSYQAEWITLRNNPYRCLINQKKLSENFDEKMISIEFDSGMKEGDNFYWDRTSTFWLVYLQQLTEEAYFRAEIRKCDYEVKVEDMCYPVYIHGPQQENEDWQKKHNLTWNELNYTLCMWIQKNEKTNKFFKREQKIKFDGNNWKVVAVDRYSQKSILEVYLLEDFNNSMEDEMEPIQVTQVYSSRPYIQGPQIVKPYDTSLNYQIKNSSNGTFVVNSKKVKIISTDSSQLVLEIISGKSGEFEIRYQVDGEEDVILPVHIVSL